LIKNQKSMKKILYLFVVIIACSCSTSTDENGNSNTTVVPLPPTGLTGSVVSPTQINLSWTDNSTNETGFKIERKSGIGNYTIIGSVGSEISSYQDIGLTPSTTYTYRIYSFNANGNSLSYSNEINITTSNIPILSTTAISSITSSTSVSGGEVTSDSGAPIFVRGVCWSTNPNPTVTLSTKTSNGTGTGFFSSNISGLSASTIYYVRAYATNSAGTAYGNEVTFITLQDLTAINVPGPNVNDIDGNLYQSVTNCGQTWTQRNLDVSKYSDGAPIPQVTDPTQWANLTTGAWCYYNNDPANGAIYGKLYNWYAVAGIYNTASYTNPSLRKKLAPAGWHIPTPLEWRALINCLDPNADGGLTLPNVAGGKMKVTGTTYWDNPNTLATNESGFMGLPGGYLSNSGEFYNIGKVANYWSSQDFSTTDAYYYQLGYATGNADINGGTKFKGFSVRCVKD
jgi:uncharacterized protein (TIGR02145 family)